MIRGIKNPRASYLNDLERRAVLRAIACLPPTQFLETEPCIEQTLDCSFLIGHPAFAISRFFIDRGQQSIGLVLAKRFVPVPTFSIVMGCMSDDRILIRHPVS